MRPRLPLCLEPRLGLHARPRLTSIAKLVPVWLRRAWPREAGARWLWIAALLLFGPVAHAFGQGCAQCLDSTRATPPAVQAAYRHAIFLLGGSGAALFAVGTLLLGRPR